MEVLRTPEDCFDGLPDYDFAPHYREVTAEDGTALRYHFIDEGPRDADPILLLHGNPSWCYLYRAMIPGLVARGHRVVALDLMGMGRSDKPVDPDVYSLASHVAWMEQWLVAEDLNRVTLFCQDWGGTAGLNLLPVQGDRFARVIASNTGLPTGQGATKMIADWLAYSQSVDVLPIGFLLQSATTRELTAEEQQAYMAPFPDGTYQASPKRFPLLIPLQEDNPGVPQAKAHLGVPDHVGEAVSDRVQRQGHDFVRRSCAYSDAGADPRGPRPAARRARGTGPLPPGGCTQRAGRDHRRLHPGQPGLNWPCAYACPGAVQCGLAPARGTAETASSRT